MNLVVRIGKKDDRVFSLYGGVYCPDTGSIQGVTFWTGAREGPTNIRGHDPQLIPGRLDARFQDEYLEFFSAQFFEDDFASVEALARMLCETARSNSTSEAVMLDVWEEKLRLFAKEGTFVLLPTVAGPRVRSLAKIVESIDWKSLYPGPDWAF